MEKKRHRHARSSGRSQTGEGDVSCEALTLVFGLLGKRWTGVLVGVLLRGPARFSALAREVTGVSERMLSERLTELGEAGLVERQVDHGPPVSVRYQLTATGEALRPAIQELQDWAAEHLGGDTAPTSTARRKESEVAPAAEDVAAPRL